MHAELRAEATVVARKRVARLMRGAGLRGVSRRRFPTTTRREPSHRPAHDLVGRDFRAAGPNRLWVADITYVPTAAGLLFLAVVLDVWSRRIVGWAMAAALNARPRKTLGWKTPAEALDAALQAAQGDVAIAG